MLNLWYYSEWLISSEVNAILLFVLASFCESAWLTANQHGNNNLERVSCDQFFLSMCFIYSWVNNFGHEGLGLLLEALEKLLDKKQWVTSYICCWVFAQCAFHSITIRKICLFFLSFRQEPIDKRNQHKLIQCLKAFMNNKVCMIQQT